MFNWDNEEEIRQYEDVRAKESELVWEHTTEYDEWETEVLKEELLTKEDYEKEKNLVEEEIIITSLETETFEEEPLEKLNDNTNETTLEKLRDSYRQKQYKETHDAKPGKEPDHIIPISVFENVLNLKDLAIKDRQEVKKIVNQDWNFRMVLKETNSQWGVDIRKLNRSFRDGSQIELIKYSQQIITFSYLHVNHNIEKFDPVARISLARYFDHFGKQIPYCKQSTRHWQ
ncbi:hypothetical protein MP638_005575 [Amoeboaphelidium occidentale]|nr:hypothetical protein MP638_005575 [Amoeboaphelidium occidentale]